MLDIFFYLLPYWALSLTLGIATLWLLGALGVVPGFAPTNSRDTVRQKVAGHIQDTRWRQGSSEPRSPHNPRD